MKNLSLILATAGLLSSSTLVAQVPGPLSGESTNPARNVILFIGDGMDEQQMTIARNYLKGANGKLVMDKLPLRSASQILTVENKVKGKPMYVADSANTATSLATGEITSRGRLATTAGL